MWLMVRKEESRARKVKCEESKEGEGMEGRSFISRTDVVMSCWHGI
jgi:hypothetical protein